ncbi:PolC-type DNA polymerase III [Halobacillus sp. A5]|uniref:3'-5' exonuclease n=1 Tax=Halobacillus sp. A5 TaxID=2880263 RepID=UPI0020A6CA7E|nr:exonuclease domain-containing protein [Halobacillus sp. A5]MCP3025741.1 3'-5' exoribonuclease [Halobacillus sp. A5]
MLPIDLQIIKYIFFEKPIYYYKIRPYLNSDRHKQLFVRLQEYKNPEVAGKSLLEIDYTIFDLETTGFIPEIGHEIISIGAVRMNGLDTIHNKTFYKLVKPIRPVSKQTFKLTGLTKEHLEQSDSFLDSLQEFLAFSEGSVLVAHPAMFDMRFVQTMLKRWKLPKMSTPVIDSQKLAKFLYPGQKPQLDPLLKKFNIKSRKRHHALNDAIMTAELFGCLLKELTSKEDHTFHELKHLLYEQQKARSL